MGEFFRGYDISTVEAKSEARLSITKSRKLEKICFAPKSQQYNASPDNFGKVGGDSPWYGECFGGLVYNVMDRKSVAKPSIIRSIKNRPVKECLATKEPHWKHPALVCSENNSTASLFAGCMNCHPFC